MAISSTTKSKLSDKEMEYHREYMKKYTMQSSDLEKHEMRYKDHYELLNIPRDAPHNEIRKAYHKLALECHPDRKPSAEALARWEGVPAAYAILSNPNDRAEYDATLATRDALVTFYRAYNPAKLDNVTIQTIIDGWHDREVELSEMLNAKYEVAPHQGITKNCQRASAISMSSEKSRKIALDSQTYKSKDAGNAEITWTGSLSSAFCCKGVLSCLFSSSYYGVNTTSPGVLTVHGDWDTPGQIRQANLDSPATPSQILSSVNPEFESDENNDSSTATTPNGSISCSDSSCCAGIEDNAIAALSSRVASGKLHMLARLLRFGREENHPSFFWGESPRLG